MDDFDKMDTEAGVEVMEAVPVGGEVVPSEHIPTVPATGITAYRDQLVRDYHKGNGSIIERLTEDGHDDTESMLTALIHEVIKETDNLLGNHLLASQNGDLRDASVISYKRAEALEKAIKAVSAKRALEKESGIDINSPSMQVIFRFFMAKANDTLVQMAMADEMKDLFFSTLGDEMENWQKELKQKFKELRTGR
jgi:isopropylmalate/homocitrate/citramalate synthase